MTPSDKPTPSGQTDHTPRVPEAGASNAGRAPRETRGEASKETQGGSLSDAFRAHWGEDLTPTTDKEREHRRRFWSFLLGPDADLPSDLDERHGEQGDGSALESSSGNGEVIHRPETIGTPDVYGDGEGTGDLKATPEDAKRGVFPIALPRPPVYHPDGTRETLERHLEDLDFYERRLEHRLDGVTKSHLWRGRYIHWGVFFKLFRWIAGRLSWCTVQSASKRAQRWDRHLLAQSKKKTLPRATSSEDKFPNQT